MSDELTRQWLDLWGGAAALTRRLDDCPETVPEFFETLAEYGGPDDLDSIQVEFTTFTDEELVLITNALRQLRQGFEGGEPDVIRDAVDALLRKCSEEMWNREDARE